MIDAGGHLCFSVEMMNAVDLLYFLLLRTAGVLTVSSILLSANTKRLTQ